MVGDRPVLVRLLAAAEGAIEDRNDGWIDHRRTLALEAAARAARKQLGLPEEVGTPIDPALLRAAGLDP
jgi:hypothetical protein